MRIVTWNVRRAHARRNTWDFALSLDADIMLLQEVGQLPMDRFVGYESFITHPLRKDGGEQKFQTAMLVRGEIIERSGLRVRPEFDHLLQSAERNMYAHTVRLRDGFTLGVLHAYSPPWPLMCANGKDTWMTELLEDAATNLATIGASPWVIGGDLNLSETFDRWSSRPRGNKAFLDAMATAGLTECLRHCQGRLTPTFLHTNRTCIHQIDHLFVSKPLADQLCRCETPPDETIFRSSPPLSDHLPIIADFRRP